MREKREPEAEAEERGVILNHLHNHLHNHHHVGESGHHSYVNIHIIEFILYLKVYLFKIPLVSVIDNQAVATNAGEETII